MPLSRLVVVIVHCLLCTRSSSSSNSGEIRTPTRTRTTTKRFQREFQRQQQLSDQWILDYNLIQGKKGHHSPQPLAECPCENPQDCRPISTTTSVVGSGGNVDRPVRATGELYGFAGSDSQGSGYNWTHISTVAWASDDVLMCEAHQHNARAVIAPPSFNLTLMAELRQHHDVYRQYIQDWVANTLTMVQARHRDGVVFDFEGPIPRKTHPMALAYVDLINATFQAFRNPTPYATTPYANTDSSSSNSTNISSSPSSPLQVTVCVPWSPYNIDGRHFPYSKFTAVSDLLYIMDYDTQSQITQGPCLASANAPFPGTRLGIQQYLELGNDNDIHDCGKLDPQKLILGVPWYGYTYPCLPDSSTMPYDYIQKNYRYCPIPLVPFRGVECSDAAGYEVPYYKLMAQFRRAQRDNSTKMKMRRDDYMDAAFFNTVTTAVNDNENTLTSSTTQTIVHQSWLDDPISLRRKYALARSTGLAGVGPFTFDDLDGIHKVEESRDMWSALDSFFVESDESPQATTRS